MNPSLEKDSMSRIRICQMITELGLAGAERCVYELSERLNKDRFDVQVVAMRGGKVAEWLREAGIKVTVLGVRGKWDLFKLRQFVGLLRRERIDILHTHLFHADLAGRVGASLAAVPHLIHTVRTAEGRFRPWQFAFARLFCDSCDQIVCISRSVRDLHSRKSGLPLSRYVVITNGIDTDAFRRDEPSRTRLRAQWGIDGDAPLVAYVGRLAREKGIEMLIAAMSHLAARGKPMDLVIAGDGPRRGVVENFIAHGEGGRRCRMLGLVDDVRGVLSAADIHVMPSRWEGFGLAAGEAMAASLPVVATRVAGLRDLIIDGRTGLLVGRDDVRALAEAVERLGDDAELRRRLGEAGRRLVVEKYRIEANIAAHEKLYLEVVSGSGVSRV